MVDEFFLRKATTYRQSAHFLTTSETSPRDTVRWCYQNCTYITPHYFLIDEFGVGGVYAVSGIAFFINSKHNSSSQSPFVSIMKKAPGSKMFFCFWKQVHISMR